MMKKLATRVIALLIVGILIWQYVEKRNDLQCYVRQQAAKLGFAFRVGYASEEAIREIVWHDTAAGFHGQLWRVKLDQVFQAIFMGGNRGAQVLAHLRHPPPDPPDLICDGYIDWTIWYEPDVTVYRDYSGTDMKTAHLVTAALKALPQEELRHYAVRATEYTYRGSYFEGGGIGIYEFRDAGEVSAREWLAGDIVPDYWAPWYAAWRENWQERQATDEE